MNKIKQWFKAIGPITPFQGRLIAVIRILKSRNFILIDGISERYSEEHQSKVWKYRLLRRTDLDTYGDFSVMKGAIMYNFPVTQLESDGV